jgi:hypothetical protein
MKTPYAIQKALDHVRVHHPDVTHVLFMRDAQWLYITDEGDAPVFGDEIDVSILEDAADAITSLPSAYAIPIGTDEQEG